VGCEYAQGIRDDRSGDVPRNLRVACGFVNCATRLSDARNRQSRNARREIFASILNETTPENVSAERRPSQVAKKVPETGTIRAI
jgi:hypothetical protein